MSYPEFMQRRSTRLDRAIVEETDLYALPGARTDTPNAASGGESEAVAAATEEQSEQQQQQQDQENDQTRPAADLMPKKQLRCVKDIWQAAIEGDVECLEANLQLGANLAELGQPVASGKDTSGGASVQIWGPLFDRCALFKATPLQYACAYNRIEAARFLLERGASWEQLSSTGVSAKDYARRRGYTEILELIEAAEQARKAANAQ